MDASSRTALRWSLFIGGALGLLCAVAMLLVTLTQFGHSLVAESLPRWAQWGAAPPGGIPMLIVGALCALLLVAGNWPTRAGAAVVAAWFAYAQAALGPGGHLAQIADQTFDYSPLWRAALVSVAALLALSVLSIVVAAHPARANEAQRDIPASSRP